ncbi:MULTISPECIES: nitrogen fixation protein NifQ [Burkholderia]|uniref:Nitrogen fixation protein NifQ n=2 Tax=Burkholderia cepacia complex TaxID=87882 RepID=A0A8A8DFW2_9BURK|nr:nitrogen fixation protein NifQ [Burkholderia seminalis]MCA8304898.1 nitrogen fixation protein NifQ [Burkholderia seminalis]MCA8424852.1 nitrogen fixation protein NifQ [Burkholderia seminalis]QTO23502.1 nitrogen fixation protein NifQ [Burkholderia seminalis]
MTAALDPARESALHALRSAAAHADTPDARLFGVLIAARACRNELSLLGLSPDQFAGLLARQFPHLAPVAALMPMVTLAVLPANHSAFVATLRSRLMDDANPDVARDDADCLASIIAHACLRPDHLWRDLGLDGRDAVSAMLDRYFPALAARNVTHLRWKKFLALEVAASLGAPPGPAPGCPGCEDFGFCFPHAR